MFSGVILTVSVHMVAVDGLAIQYIVCRVICLVDRVAIASLTEHNRNC